MTVVSWIEGYDDRTVDEVREVVDERDPTDEELAELLAYERANRDRVTLTGYLESRIDRDGTGAAPAGDGDRPGAEVEDRIEALDARLTERLEAVESAFAEKLRDVRERVIQVKRETDQKAPRDHGHPGIADRLDRVADAVERLDDELDDLEGTTSTGFRNYESVLEYLAEEAEDHGTKLDRLAAVTLELRDGLDEMRRAHARRAAVEQLAAEAIRHGARTAECESCGQAVPVGMLSSPRCPHCGEAFSEFAPKRGLLGTHTLLTGTHPALEPGPADAPSPGGDGPSIHDVVDGAGAGDGAPRADAADTGDGGRRPPDA